MWSSLMSLPGIDDCVQFSLIQYGLNISSVQFSCSVMSDSLQPHGLKHARSPCPSPSPGVYSNSCPSSQWCHATTHPPLSPSPPAFNLSGVISPHFSSSVSGTYRPGEFIFQCHIFLPFRAVYGVLKARVLKWFAIPFSKGLCFVRTLHNDPSILGGPTWHGSVSLS